MCFKIDLELCQTITESKVLSRMFGPKGAGKAWLKGRVLPSQYVKRRLRTWIEHGAGMGGMHGSC
jgi:hypothetical protein